MNMGILDKVKAMFRERLDVNQRFELLREAISGTMSEFYVARDRQNDQIVGLKLLDPDKTAAFSARFKGLDKPTEGQIASSINHPRVVSTLEQGESNRGQHYLVMEFLDGPGLNSLILEKNTAMKQHRVTLIRQMAEAVEAVHEAGYIHRDICPRNFICTKDADSLKLIDFGLSLPMEKAYMRPGNRTGTPNYMAPEIVRRRSTNQRVDLFALGVTAYQTCALTLPWPGGDNTGLAAMQHGVHKPVNLMHICPDLDPTLAAAITQCLEADSNRRPQSAGEFLKTIQGVLPV